MGAIEVRLIGKGRTMQEAWKQLQEDDRHEKGNDLYNGSVAHCHVLKEVKELPEHGEKYHAYGKCISKPVGNTNKVKTEVHNYPCKETRKWVTKYVGHDQTGQLIHSIKSDSQTKCIELARIYVERNPRARINIQITKELEKLNPLVATINYKQATGEKLGEYEFFAVAPY